METDATDHGAYYDVDEKGTASASLKNQANVIVGKHERVRLEE